MQKRKSKKKSHCTVCDIENINDEISKKSVNIFCWRKEDRVLEAFEILKKCYSDLKEIYNKKRLVKT